MIINLLDKKIWLKNGAEVFPEVFIDHNDFVLSVNGTKYLWTLLPAKFGYTYKVNSKRKIIYADKDELIKFLEKDGVANMERLFIATLLESVL